MTFMSYIIFCLSFKQFIELRYKIKYFKFSKILKNSKRLLITIKIFKCLIFVNVNVTSKINVSFK